MLLKQTKVRKARGLSFLAVVILDTDIMLTTKHQISQGFEAAGIPYCFFISVKDALASLESQGYCFDKSEAVRFFNRFDFST